MQADVKRGDGHRAEEIDDDQLRPKPREYSIAFKIFSLSFWRLEYSGSKRTLKQVWAVGNLDLKKKVVTLDHRSGSVLWSVQLAYFSVSGPFLAMVSLSSAKPPCGHRSVPVVNLRNNIFCSSVNSSKTSQKPLQNGGKWTQSPPGWEQNGSHGSVSGLLDILMIFFKTPVVNGRCGQRLPIEYLKRFKP